ncbi:TlpA disulfide reductase family protein [Pedobacter metabolipauper]|uniref:Thiol-disulfide isomerase/thioredoxin n=1 Tax=Pedobacter metabolipauper TaxID=425513 RepID=A0A4R6SNU6_9SPHI|nr:TlpA disulfide reductase family protein [Pedobacter metabolipauper]TDQ06196.1 thiol-disulfide isomerase/thioredoxin [Pedobacter metabolipauper]
MMVTKPINPLSIKIMAINPALQTLRFSIFAVLFLTQLAAFSQSGKYTVSGKVTGWKDKHGIVLMYRQNDSLISDTAEVLDGTFKYSGHVLQPVEATIYQYSPRGKGSNDRISFILSPVNIKIIAPDSLAHAKTPDDLLNKENQELKAQTEPLLNRLVKLKMKAIKTTKEEQLTAEFKQLEKEYYAVIDSSVMVRKAFIKTHPKSFISLIALKYVSGSPVDYNRGGLLYESLSAEVKKQPLGVEIGKSLELAKQSKVGAILPGFTSLDTLRQPLSLQQVVKKGKVTLVDFWASWCAPCRKENPNVVKAYTAFHDKGFNILSVSLDRTAEAWKKAIETDGMPWYHVSSLKYWDEPIAKLYGISGVPDSFLLDADGKVVARGLRGEALYKKIGELLK